MNKEAYEIRHEINRLKQRLLEIEGDNISKEEIAKLCTSNVCGQDVIIEHLQKLNKERNTESIANMSAWRENDKRSMFYSSTITPDFLPYLIRNVQNIVDFYSQILTVPALRILEYLSIEECSGTLSDMESNLELQYKEIEKSIKKLMDLKLLIKDDEIYSTSNMGWKIYIVLTHLAYENTFKLNIETAIKIVPAFQEVFHIQWGESLGMDYYKALEELDKSGWLVRLNEQGVDDKEIETAIYEATIMDRFKK